jgi:predicted patatin/cPLA2 family phospholipase
MKTVSRRTIGCLLILAAGLTGCGLPRNPVPTPSISNAQIPGLSHVRYWELEYKPDVSIGADSLSDCSFLALSGGGANGAFGAGFLCGWTASGTRPNFRIVTGISTGALTAPLAFLGPEYDEKLKKYYTTVRTRDIFDVQGLLGFGILPILTGESYASTRPLLRLITELVDEETLSAIARENAKGRRLYIGTTDLDAQRLVIWDMGAIASSGQSDTLKLFRKVMLASASIPGAFPPVYFNVKVDGKKYDEMHVDGGVITEVFGYGRLFAGWVANQKSLCSIYVIRNGKLDTEAEQVPRRVIKIVIRSFSTLMKAHSWNDLFRLYATAKEDGVDFNYVSIPTGYESHAREMFDPVEMKRLFDLGYEMAKSGYKWNKAPPGLRGAGEAEWIWTP